MTDQLLTNTDIEAIKARYPTEAHYEEDHETVHDDIHRLLAEVERLRANEVEMYGHVMDALNDLCQVTDPMTDEMLDKLFVRRAKLNEASRLNEGNQRPADRSSTRPAPTDTSHLEVRKSWTPGESI